MIAVVALACGAVALLRRPRAKPRRRQVLVTTPAVPNPPAEREKTDLEHLLEAYVADDPTPGRFYQVQPDDTPAAVAATALGPTAHAQDVVEYLMCIASGPAWNMSLYGTPSTSRQYPAALLVPGVRTGIRVAFLPRNEDALGLMLLGKHPRMTVHPRTGEPVLPGSSYGLLWLPPVNEAFSCEDYTWEDGTSTIDPPPELLELLS